MFKSVSPKLNLPTMEEGVLRFWKAQNIFSKSSAQRAGGPEYVFYEGPPTANGKPGVHHVLARAFKDVFPRYKTMRGYNVVRRGGWDTHGLPVEIEVEKQLGFTSKGQIEEYGIDRFNALCRQDPQPSLHRTCIRLLPSRIAPRTFQVYQKSADLL